MGGGSFCELSFEGAHGVKELCDVGRFLPNASPGMGGFSSCFSRVSVRVRVLPGTLNECVIVVNIKDVNF